jgi:hypothetical protein
MSNKPDEEPTISRRDCLASASAALLAVSQPALAAEPRIGPKGHRRLLPAFRRVNLDK